MELDINAILRPTPKALWYGENRMYQLMRLEMRHVEACLHGNADAATLYERQIDEIAESLQRDLVRGRTMVDSAMAFLAGGFSEVRRCAENFGEGEVPA